MAKLKISPDCILGLCGTLAGCLILFVWIPLDVETGLIENVRSQVMIGDAMAPSLAASVLILSGILILLQSFKTSSGSGLDWNSLKFLVLLLTLLGVSLAVMRWSGPLTAGILHTDYRSLRDTIPWKYIGYLSGGIIMVFGLISTMEHRMRLWMFIVSLLAVILMMLVYDLPFQNLMLPPNGDF